MKIKEVMKRTGLTERTIRFYVEQQLIDPKLTIRNGREYREYSEQDVAELITIADLRRLYFSIEEIRTMKEHPEKISEIVSAYKEKVALEARILTAVTETLDGVNLSAITDISVLSDRLKTVSTGLPLPKRDIHPDFGKFESNTKAEREREYEKFAERQERQFRLGKAIVFTIASLNILFTLLSAFLNFNFFSVIIQIALSIALYMGVAWVRYLFAIGAVLGIFFGIALLVELAGLASSGAAVPAWIFILNGVMILFAGASSLLLLFNSAVSEFLYAQKNG